MAKCDICGQDAVAHSMEWLRDIYRQPGLVDVCPACSKWCNDQLRDIRAQQETELKLRICVRAARPVRRRWLSSWWVCWPAFIAFVSGCIWFFNYCLP